MSYIDLTGQRFGRQIAIEKVGTNHEGRAVWNCKCDCGKEITTTSANLLRWHTTSCGCYQKEQQLKAHITHGDAHHTKENKQERLYKIWADAKSRCRCPSCRAYKNYGGRGIQFSKEWDHYEDFKEWALANGYRDNLTLDRIDNEKGYGPDNCRWATWKEQANNTRRCRMVEYNGKKQSVAMWASELDMPYTSLLHKLNRGLTLEEVIGGKEVDEHCVFVV